MKSYSDSPHRRYNPLSNEWVLVSPHRNQRPWQGQREKSAATQRPAYDPDCYLCPGNTRASGDVNEAYTSTYVFTNDYSALLPNTSEQEYSNGLLQAKSERGICRVLCFSPRHDLTIPQMEVEEVSKVVGLWVKEYQDLGARDFINHVQIFENKGSVMGCSNPHPHGQIWAQSSIPVEVDKELKQQEAYFEQHGSLLLMDYLKTELEDGSRLIVQNNSFVALVPYWAIWPYEAMILPRRRIADLSQLNLKERKALADIYIQLTIRYDNLFETSFPYSAGIHQRPTDGNTYAGCLLHMHFYPPLLRSASVKKFMVGYEMLANAQRDITPEQSAAQLRALGEVHYLQR